MGERSRPRDLYDIVISSGEPISAGTLTSFWMFLRQKCQVKGIPVPSAESIQASPMFEELKSEWGNMLAHQLQALPDFDHFWAEVPHIFAWLYGEEPTEELPPVPLKEDEKPLDSTPDILGVGSRQPS